MPYLGDFLGHLAAEITLARVQADLETARVAELYATHPLLKHMPVPHFRLPSVNVTVPVAIQQMDEVKDGRSPRGDLDAASVRKQYLTGMTRALEQQNLVLAPAAKKKVEEVIDKALAGHSDTPYLSSSAIALADELTRAITPQLPAPTHGNEKADVARARVADVVRTTTRTELSKLRQPPPRLHVLVTTPELREAGPKDILTQLNLTISEQGVEWVTVETQGKESARLRPE